MFPVSCLPPFFLLQGLGSITFANGVANHHDLSSAKKNHEGGHATEGRDSAGGVAKAKREHPEAPDPAIGMQDERGGRGG
jgi:hypothetical protein